MALTAAKDVGIFYLTAGISHIVGAKLGSLLGGSLGGMIGYIIGMGVGAVIGWLLDNLASEFIDWAIQGYE